MMIDDHVTEHGLSFAGLIKFCGSRLDADVNFQVQQQGRIVLMAMLKVDRTQFLDGLRVLDGMVKRKHQAKAVFAFVDGLLSIKIANTVVEMPAAGQWPGTAKIHARMLFTASPPPSIDSVTLRVEGNRFFIERLSTLCEWIESKRSAV
jgi:hypothetical protein